MFSTPFTFMAAPAGGGFTPADISDLVGWWDAGDNVTLSGSDVTAWGDKSTGGMGSFTKQSGTDYVYYASGFGTNSLPYIKTKTATYYQSANDWSSTSSATVFVIGQVSAGVNTYARYMSTTTDYPNAFTWLITNSSPYSFNSSFSSDLTGSDMSSIAGTPILIRTRWNGTNSYMKVNTLTEYSSGGVISSQGNVKLILGYSNLSYSEPFDVAEIIVYNKYLSNSELTQMNDYITTKYGITF